MPRKGRDLEKFVRSIESILKSNPNAKLQSPGLVLDNATNKNREFDVLITIVEGPRSNITGIECRDRKSRIDVSHVEAFVTKCRDCLINKGVMVSSLGFTKGAVAKGFRHNVQCLTLREAKKIDWIEASEFGVVKRKLIGTHLSVPEGVEPLENIQVCDKDGNVASPEAFTAYARQILNQVAFGDEMVGEHAKRVKLSSVKNGVYALTSDGKIHEMDPVFLTLKYMVEKSMKELALHTYTDASTGSDVSRMGSVILDEINGLKPRLMFIEEADGSKSVSLAFE
ncbi:MAG: hypothetical protein ABL936_20320 [Aestuariivirga sp.]